MLTCGASGAPLFSPSVRVTAGYRGEERGDNKRETRTAKKEALLEKTPTALFILRFAAGRGRRLPQCAMRAPRAIQPISRHVARIVWGKYAQCGLKTLCSPFCRAIHVPLHVPIHVSIHVAISYRIRSARPSIRHRMFRLSAVPSFVSSLWSTLLPSRLLPRSVSIGARAGRAP